MAAHDRPDGVQLPEQRVTPWRSPAFRWLWGASVATSGAQLMEGTATYAAKKSVRTAGIFASCEKGAPRTRHCSGSASRMISAERRLIRCAAPHGGPYWYAQPRAFP